MTSGRRTVANAAHRGVGVDRVFAEVGEATGLLDERGRKTVGVGLVVDQAGGDEIPHLKANDSVNHTVGPTKRR